MLTQGGKESVRLIITETDRGKAAAAAAAKEEEAQSEMRKDVLVGRLTDVCVGGGHVFVVLWD